MITVRQEREGEHRSVELLIREAFWNIYIPGCIEHYLAHSMRGHADFIPELDLVLELDGVLAASVMYTKAYIENEDGQRKEVLTFGPLCVAPSFQKRGLGKMLLEESFKKAGGLGYEVIVIFGNPSYYVSSGFASCKKYGVSLPDGSYPTAMLVKELSPFFGEKKHWVYYASSAMDIREEDALHFDEGFEKKEKKSLPSQEVFYILKNSVLR